MMVLMTIPAAWADSPRQMTAATLQLGAQANAVACSVTEITVLESALRIKCHNYPPATFELIVLRDDYLADEVAARVGTLLREVKPAGVAMMLLETIPGDAGFVEAAGSPWFRLPLDVGPLARTL